MVAMTVDASEFNALTIDMRAAHGRIGRHASLALRRATFQMEAIAKLNCPVDSGHLLSSIGPAEFSGDGRSGAMTGSVTAKANYARFVEFGTSRMAPSAFMGPAFDRAQPRFITEVGDIAAALAAGGGPE